MKKFNLAAIYNSKEVQSGIAKVKAMADLKTNIQWEKYDQSIAETGDFLNSDSMQVQNSLSPSITKLNVTENKKAISLSREEVIDSVFTTYKVLKIKEKDLVNRKILLERLPILIKKKFQKPLLMATTLHPLKFVN